MTDRRNYRVNEIFHSLQGEGVQAGTPYVFVRLAGCNLSCSVTEYQNDTGDTVDDTPGDTRPPGRTPVGFDCDTEFAGFRGLAAQEVAATARSLAPQGRWACLTGGEPALQADAPLVAALRDAGFRVAMETNGTLPLDGWWPDWICVSPKTAEHTLRVGLHPKSEFDVGVIHELKYVRHEGQALPRPKLRASHYLISPAFAADGTVPRGTLEWCIRLVKENPTWRLSMQQHKWWGVR